MTGSPGDRPVYPERMSETPVVNYTEDAVSGFGDPLPGGIPVIPDLSPEPPPEIIEE